MPDMSRPLQPVAFPSPRPWAGTRLGAGIGERWLAGPDSLVAGDGAFLTLDALAARAGATLVGSRGMVRLGARFPLLVKVIDAADWLSLQVHPSDAVARRLHGEGAVGKAEAWVILDAAPDAVLVTGPRADLPAEAVRAAIEAGTLDRAECESRPAVPGDVLHLEAGTIHAIGAGAFIYEIEQPSDLTFRISDWGRPESPGRPLHRAEALLAVEPTRHAVSAGAAWRLDGGALDTEHFRLEAVGPGERAHRSPAGLSLEVVTAVGGDVILDGDGWREVVEALGTVVVPAAVPAYRIAPGDGARALVGSLPARA